MSLLNAILRLKGTDRIIDLTVMDNKQLTKKLLEDKTGRLDVRAETADRVQINIELQLTDYHNMPRRTLFYLSKLFADSIKAGGKYEELKKTITINIVDFRLFEFGRFHSTFHFYEDHEERFMLTDAMEVHFIEYPKFKAAQKNMEDPLHRWLLFLDEKLSDQQLKELIEMDSDIERAERRLEWLSADEETIRLYEAREHSLIERNSLIAEGEARGEARGEMKAKAAIAETMLREGMDSATIQRMTSLTEAEIARLSKLLKG